MEYSQTVTEEALASVNRALAAVRRELGDTDAAYVLQEASNSLDTLVDDFSAGRVTAEGNLSL